MRLIACMFVAAMLAGCSNAPAPVGYPLSVDEAYQRLSTSRLDDLRRVFQCGILIHLHPQGVPGESVTWRVTSSGREMLHFTVKLVPVEGGRVKTELSMSPGKDGGEAYDGNQKYIRPAFNQPLRPAIEEQIAALLEGRPLDVKRLPKRVDEVCSIQKLNLEHGRPFSVRDKPGQTAAEGARERAATGWGPGREGWGQ